MRPGFRFLREQSGGEDAAMRLLRPGLGVVVIGAEADAPLASLAEYVRELSQHVVNDGARARVVASVLGDHWRRHAPPQLNAPPPFALVSALFGSHDTLAKALVFKYLCDSAASVACSFDGDACTVTSAGLAIDLDSPTHKLGL
jgi:hypothetical protein